MKLQYSVTLLGLLATFAAGAAACSDDDGGTTSASSSTTGTGGGATSGGATGGGGAGGAGEGGGATSGGATGGGGAGEGGGTGGGSACEALLCDDFESYEGQGENGEKLGAWTVYTAMAGSTVSVDTERHYSGTKSIKVTTPASTGDNNYKSAMIKFADTDALPTAENVVHGRMMFFLEAAPTGDVHWTIIDGSGTIPGSDFEGNPYAAQYRYGGQHPVTGGSQLMANYDTPGYWSDPKTGPQSDCWHHAENKVVPVGAWTCVEFSFDGPKNEMRFWLNGAEVPELKVSGTGQGCANNVENYEWTAPAFDSVGLGWESYQADSARSMWIDDVVIGTGPIGCPPAQ
ncbi:hypothetical protein WME79_45680 [Sorangium sp. So ce726]|uniref:hypothetical protein n=1 Tax=Sorangium sp. So ce726 TaxID=3133319 RepID=UPI003F63A13D